MHYMKIDRASVADGVGFRVVLYVAGCQNHCEGCHNKDTWDFNAGVPFETKAEEKVLSLLARPYIRGLTLSGGEPMESKNVETVLHLIRRIREKLPNKDIWLYTGYDLPALQSDPIKYQVLEACDVVVYGPFVEAEKDLSIPFRGSRNQRILVHQSDITWYAPTDDEVREGKVFQKSPATTTHPIL